MDTVDSKNLSASVVVADQELNESETNVRGVAKPQSAGTLVGKQTPVLYTTDRGLFVRTFDSNRLVYETRFCDLEKWTGRKESIGLTPDSGDASQQKLTFNKSVRFVESKPNTIQLSSPVNSNDKAQKLQADKEEMEQGMDYG